MCPPSGGTRTVQGVPPAAPSRVHGYRSDARPLGRGGRRRQRRGGGRQLKGPGARALEKKRHGRETVVSLSLEYRSGKSGIDGQMWIYRTPVTKSPGEASTLPRAAAAQVAGIVAVTQHHAPAAFVTGKMVRALGSSSCCSKERPLLRPRSCNRQTARPSSTYDARGSQHGARG
jgi:hypothetical protein